MKTWSVLTPLCAVALCAITGTAVAHPENLRGWGPYKFGMTEQQVMSAANADLEPANDAPNALLTHVMIGRYRTTVALIFDRLNDALSTIMLNTNDGAHCAGAAGYFRTGLTKKYGLPRVIPVPVAHANGEHEAIYVWKFANGFQIALDDFGAVCAIVVYSPTARPVPKAGF